MTCEKSQKPNVGDIVHIRVRVVVSHGGCSIGVIPAHWQDHECNRKSNYLVLAPDILKVEERPLAVGDWVWGEDWKEGLVGTPRIVAIDEDKAWLKFQDGSRGTYKLCVLKRID